MSQPEPIEPNADDPYAHDETADFLAEADRLAVLAANAAYYDAFERRDFDAISDLWEHTGFLFGMAALVYGVSRFAIEFVREPDAHLVYVVEQTGLSMGQWLTVPMIVVGLYLVLTASGRRQRVEPFVGADSVA